MGEEKEGEKKKKNVKESVMHCFFWLMQEQELS